jgi:DNA-binding phage protein
VSYNQQLHIIVDAIFAAADDLRWGVQKIAKASGLHWQTVQRLNTYTTQYPRLRTVFLMAKAVGLEFEVVREASKSKKKVG